MTMRWGVIIAVLTALGGGAAHAQALQSQAPAGPRTAPPLQLKFPKSYAAPQTLAPGASWDAPALAPVEDGEDRRLALNWHSPQSAWDVSAAVNFIEQSRLNAGDFQTGGLFEADVAVTRRFGDFRVGAVGYSARDAGENVGYGPSLGEMRWRGSAAGPVVGYDAEIAGRPATLSLRWYREIGTPGENGDTAAASFALKF